MTINLVGKLLALRDKLLFCMGSDNQRLQQMLTRLEVQTDPDLNQTGLFIPTRRAEEFFVADAKVYSIKEIVVFLLTIMCPPRHAIQRRFDVAYRYEVSRGVVRGNTSPLSIRYDNTAEPKQLTICEGDFYSDGSSGSRGNIVIIRVGKNAFKGCIICRPEIDIYSFYDISKYRIFTQ